MTEAQFISQNEPNWKQLESFNQALNRKGISSLSKEEIISFAKIFRAVGYNLAYAKTHFPKGASLPYLTHLVGVAQNYYYVKEKGSIYTVKEYFTKNFPNAARCAFWYALVSASLFFAGMLFAYAYVAADIRHFNQIFPMEFTGGELGNGEAMWDYPLMSAYIMTNNIRVSIMALVFGVTAGIGTVWILFYNGLIVGALASYVAITSGGGDTLTFWSLILPHGIMELTAIFLSGACGLMIGKAMIIPGNFTRYHAVVNSARQAVMLVPGIVTMLVIAGIIEGFFTPLDIHATLKLAFALLTFIGIYIYFSKKLHSAH